MKRALQRTVALSFFAIAGLAFVQTQTACSSSLAQPFEQKKNEPITIFRLQNFEPPQQQAQANPAAGMPGLPPQIQQWLQGAAQALPPGLLPPGLIPGTAPAPVAATVPRYYNFPILGSMSITDSKMREEILDLFGKESNFQAPKQSCMYAEFGFQIGQAGPPGVQGAPTTSAPADILVSLSCDQVQMFNYGWPYGSKTGLGPDTSKKIIAIVQKAFGG
jgi:hypothetical protein